MISLASTVPSWLLLGHGAPAVAGDTKLDRFGVLPINQPETVAKRRGPLTGDGL